MLDHKIEEYIQEIKTRINIVDFIGRFVRLRKAGQNFVGLCPFHVEKTPSFSVNPTKEIFYCFGCHVGGDIIRFVEKYEGYTFQEAIEFLGKEAGLEPPQWGRSKQNSKYEDWYSILLDCTLFFQKQLSTNKEAKMYLQNRKINSETIRKFQLGFAPFDSQQFVSFLQKKGFDKEASKTIGLLREKEDGYLYPYFRNRIIFPIFDHRNRPIGFGGRGIEKEATPKYLNSPDYSLFHKGHNLYALSFARSEINRSKRAIVVEGYMDVISLHQRGVKNVVASLGTAFTLEQATLLRKYAETIYFCYDSDNAGKKATLRAIDIILPLGFPCRVIQVPKPFKDPDEYILSKGNEAFEQLIQNAKSALEFYWDCLIEDKNLKDPITVSSVVESILRRCAIVKDPVRVEALLKKISLDAKLKPMVLEERFRSYYKKRTTRRRQAPKSYPKKTDTVVSERDAILLLKAIITAPDIFSDIVFAKLEPTDFPEGIYRDLFTEFQKALEEKKPIQIENFQGDPDKENFYSKLMELQNMNNNCIDGDVIPQIICSIDVVRKEQTVLKPLKQQIANAERNGDLETSKKLREEFRRLVQEEC